MNSTEKKLDALIDALGFDVEASGSKAIVVNDGLDVPFGVIKVIEDSRVYKLTDRKPACVPLPIQSDAWGCVVDFLTSHNNDIENDINDYGTLKPMLNFINGNSNE